MIRFGAHEPLPVGWGAVPADEAEAWEAIWAANRRAVVREAPLPVGEWLAREAVREAEITAWVRADLVQGDLFA